VTFVIKTRKKSQKHFWEARGCGSPALAPEAATVAWKKTPSQLPRVSFRDAGLDGEGTGQACPVLLYSDTNFVYHDSKNTALETSHSLLNMK